MPDNTEWIMRRLRVSQGEYERAVLPVIDEFFSRHKGRILNHRLQREHAHITGVSKKRSAAGKKGGRPRKPQKLNGFDQSQVKAKRKQLELEPNIDKDGGDGRDPDFQTDRELILIAMGHDKSGVTASGGLVGNLADILELSNWERDLQLTRAEIISVVTEVSSKKRDGPAVSFKYFTNAMQRLAGDKSGPKLTQITGGQPNASSKTDRFRRVNAAAARGTSQKDWG